jgi:septum site-determining protein MinD
MLQILRKHFQYIFIDCGHAIYPLHVNVLEVSSLVLFCLTPELVPIHRSGASIQTFEELAFPSQMVQLVLNQYDPKGAIPAKVIEQKLKRSVLGTLAAQPKEHAHAVQQARPLTLVDPRAPYAQNIEAILRSLVTSDMLKPIDARKLADSAGLHQVHHLQQGTTQPMPKGIQQVANKEIERMDAIRVKIHQELINRMDFKQLSAEELMKQDEASLDRLRQKTHEMILSIVSNMPEIKQRQERQTLVTEVLNEAIGLGPLEYMLSDPSISEIMVNRCDQIYIEQNGKLTLSSARFSSDKQLMGVIERIVAPIGRQINEKTPMVDARLRDGSRVHAIIPPLALDGPILTIRKFSTDLLGPKELIKFGAMTPEMGDFLRACVQAHLNIVISGGTGTGKTTLLNCLASFIPNQERIITVEDSAELQLPQEHIGRLESRPANLKGEGAIPIRELIRNTLRMRPDRIIVGECRGAEALDMLQAMNTGHDGSMTTLHSNSPRDCISRLETLVMFAGMDLPSKAIRDQIASAVTLIVQLSRLGDGSRKITSITEVTGMEGGEIMLQEIFTFKEQGMDASRKVKGQFMATGLVPTFAKKFKQKGIKLPKGLLDG